MYQCSDQESDDDDEVEEEVPHRCGRRFPDDFPLDPVAVLELIVQAEEEDKEDVKRREGDSGDLPQGQEAIGLDDEDLRRADQGSKWSSCLEPEHGDEPRQYRCTECRTDVCHVCLLVGPHKNHERELLRGGGGGAGDGSSESSTFSYSRAAEVGLGDGGLEHPPPSSFSSSSSSSTRDGAAATVVAREDQADAIGEDVFMTASEKQKGVYSHSLRQLDTLIRQRTIESGKVLSRCEEETEALIGRLLLNQLKNRRTIKSVLGDTRASLDEMRVRLRRGLEKIDVRMRRVSQDGETPKRQWVVNYQYEHCRLKSAAAKGQPLFVEEVVARMAVAHPDDPSGPRAVSVRKNEAAKLPTLDKPFTKAPILPPNPRRVVLKKSPILEILP